MVRYWKSVSLAALVVATVVLGWSSIAVAVPSRGHYRNYFPNAQKVPAQQIGMRNLLTCYPNDYSDPDWGSTSAYYIDVWYPCGDP